ncbi:hypothetical protein Pcinc_003905 [Petrolisthes cinctipes]|uniref:Uncharacterized protein n=1 Tax=Petrolisthes cinctipes TaxID=88211 RepID=A0AAE1L0T6_PETCI|nr:hypothetical protein Pcinc_003905 [Petrolisthes cinctipes]
MRVGSGGGVEGGWVFVLAVLLLTFHTAYGHFILTEDGVTQEFDIPDEQTVRLMFWVERDESQDDSAAAVVGVGASEYNNEDEEREHESKRRSREQQQEVREHPHVTREEKQVREHHYVTREQQHVRIEEQQVREDPHVSREEQQVREHHHVTREHLHVSTEEQQVREHPHVTREQQQIREHHQVSTEQQHQVSREQQHATGDISGVSSTFLLERNVHINLTYIVSVFQYPTLHLVISERSRWLSAHFYHDRVYIPSADVDVYPTPPSWWGRKVIITSSKPVYWYLCRSPYSCDPGSPLEQVQVIRSRVGSDVKCDADGGVSVVTLGVLVGGLTLLSLALTVILCYHRYHHSQDLSNTQHQAPSHSPQYPVIAPSPQYPVIAPSPQYPVIAPSPQYPATAPRTQPQHPALSTQPQQRATTPRPQPRHHPLPDFTMEC